MATELLSLFAKIGIDDKEYNKGIDGAKSKASKLAKGLKTGFKVGAAAIGVTTAAIAGMSKVLYSGIKDTTDYGDEVDKMSQKLGLSAEAYQKWDYVLKIAGTEMSSMTTGLKTLTNKLDDAKNGGESAIATFEAIGLSMDDIQDVSREEVFEKTIRAFQGMEESAERAALANDLFGKSGQNLAPLFNESAESTDALIKKAQDYGMIMSDDAVEASAAFHDSLTTLSQTTTGLKNRLMGELLPGITSITDGLALMFTSDGQGEGLEKFNEGITETLNNISELIPKIAKIGLPIIENIATGIIENLPALVNTALTVVVDLAGYIVDNLPLILSTGLSIIISLVQGITAAIPELLPAITQVIIDLATMLTDPEMLTTLIEAALELVIALAEGLVEAIPTLVEVIPTIIENLVNSIVKLLPIIIQAGITLMEALFQGWLDALPIVLPSIIQAVLTISQTLTEPENLKLLLDAAILLLEAMIEGFTEAMPAIMSAIWQMLLNIINVIKSYFVSMKDNGKELIDKLKEGIQEKTIAVKQHIRDMMHHIHETIKAKVDAAKQWGRDLIQNFIDGITAKFQALKEKVISVASTVKDYLGFSEPKKGPLSSFHTFAPDMIDLWNKGISDNLDRVALTARDMAGTVADNLYLDGTESDYETEQTNTFEFRFAEGTAPLQQIARLLYPYMKVVAVERGD